MSKFTFNLRSHNIKEVIKFVIQNEVQKSTSYYQLADKKDYPHTTVYVWIKQKIKVLNTFLNKPFEFQKEIMNDFDLEEIKELIKKLKIMGSNVNNFLDEAIKEKFLNNSEEFINKMNQNLNEIIDIKPKDYNTTMKLLDTYQVAFKKEDIIKKI